MTLATVPAATAQHDATPARRDTRTGRSARAGSMARPARRAVPHPRPELLVAAAQRRTAERTHGLIELLESRPDLRGTHAPADFAVEAVLWAV
jgi:hypothetical protein